MPTPEFYDIGEVVVISDDIDVDGVLTDPGTLTISYRRPDGTEVSKTYLTDAEVVKDSTGRYHMDVATTMAGEWAARVSAAGLGAGAAETTFHVRATRF